MPEQVRGGRGPGPDIAKSYDAKIPLLSYADHTSFVIVPGGTV